MLWSITPAQIAFRQPSMLRRLTYELQVIPNLRVFSNDYLLQNLGSPELVPKRLVLYNAWGRFVAAWSFLHLGWYCFGLGALLVGAYAIAQMPNGRSTRVVPYFAFPSALSSSFLSRRPLASTITRGHPGLDRGAQSGVDQ